MVKEVLLGNEAIVKAALEAGVDFVSGYPGCPAAEVGDEFGKIAKENGIYFEWSTNEKVALEAAIGASFSGLKTLVAMKNFGLNVCAEALLPLCYTGTNAPMVVVVGDDPSCWSSAQTEENSRGYAFIAHIPVLEPSDCQECHDFTKLAFEISEKFKLPVILRTTIRVAHQRAPVQFEETGKKELKKGNFIKNPHQYVTLPPRVLEMKKELLEKMEKIQAYAEKEKINFVKGGKSPFGTAQGKKIGIIASGVGYLHLMEAQKEMGLDLPVLKINLFYPLTEKTVADFVKKLNKVLIVEELDGYLEKETKVIARESNPKIKISGKDLLSEIGELNVEKVGLALAKLTGKKIKIVKPQTPDIPRRYAKLCDGCPHFYTFSVIKKVAPENTIFGGDIGCYMIAGMPPHNIQDYEFCMGSSLGIAHGVRKSTNQKVIALIGDGTFFHSGIAGLINTVYNKSNPLIIILDNRITAMTGHQNNPGMGKNGMGEPAQELNIEEIVRACGVKSIKVLDPINVKELEDTVTDFLSKEEVSVIVCKRICALLARRQQNG